MPAAYIPLLIVALLMVSLTVGSLIAFRFIRRETREVVAVIEPADSVIPVEFNAREACSEKFYLGAMLVVIFDVGIVFLFLWAILFRGWVGVHRGAFGLASITVFIGILLCGFWWMCKKGGLDWE
jgi:NADH-quinone oxidoreductase subunit A